MVQYLHFRILEFPLIKCISGTRLNKWDPSQMTIHSIQSLLRRSKSRTRTRQSLRVFGQHVLMERQSRRGVPWTEHADGSKRVPNRVPNMLEKWTSHEQPWSPAILQFTNWFNRFWPMAALWCQDVPRWSPISRACGAFPCISDVAVIPIRWSGTTILILVPLHNGPNNERRIPLL